MGSVWVATDPQLERKVAIKLILHTHSPDAVARFMREARMAAKIQSPHAVVVYDCGEALLDDVVTPYIAMEVLDGEDLKARLDRTSTLSLRETARVVSHVAKALAAAHKIGVVHRDIKVDNIFLVPEEGGGFTAKVLDFGIAKSILDPQGITATGETIGTPHYMSPEQVRCDPRLSPATDLWSLGVVAYRCLTGALPFTSPSLFTLLPVIVQGAFAAPSTVSPAVPATLDAWFARALAKAPEARFTTALEMADTFAEVISALPTTTASAPAPSFTVRATEAASAPLDTQSALGAEVTAGAPPPSGMIRVAALLAALAVLGFLVLVLIKVAPARATRGQASSASPAATAEQSIAAAPEIAPEPRFTASATTTATAAPSPVEGDALPPSRANAPPPSSAHEQRPEKPAPAVARPTPKPVERRSLGF